MNKQDCLEKAIEITKEWARGGAAGSPAGILEELYNRLLKLAEIKE